MSESDHCTVSAKLDFRISQENPYTRCVWCYKDGDYDSLRSAVKSANWDECFLSDNIDVICESYTEKFLTIARAFVPSKTAVIRPNDKPWYDNKLRLIKRKVKRLYVLNMFIDIQTSKELIQMDINKKMRNGIFTMNGEHTQSEN